MRKMRKRGSKSHLGILKRVLPINGVCRNQTASKQREEKSMQEKEAVKTILPDLRGKRRGNTSEERRGTDYESKVGVI